MTPKRDLTKGIAEIEACATIEEMCDLINTWYPQYLPSEYHLSADEAYTSISSLRENENCTVDMNVYDYQYKWLRRYSDHWDNIV